MSYAVDLDVLHAVAGAVAPDAGAREQVEWSALHAEEAGPLDGLREAFADLEPRRRISQLRSADEADRLVDPTGCQRGCCWLLLAAPGLADAVLQGSGCARAVFGTANRAGSSRVGDGWNTSTGSTSVSPARWSWTSPPRRRRRPRRPSSPTTSLGTRAAVRSGGCGRCPRPAQSARRSGYGRAPAGHGSRASRSPSVDLCVRGIRGPRRSGGTARPVCSRSCPPSRPGPSPGLEPAPPGSGRSCPRFWHAAASSTGRPRPQRRSSRRTPPRCSYPRPDLLLPQLHRAVVTLDRPPSGLLPRPPVTLQKPPCALHRVGHVEEPADQLLDARQGPPPGCGRVGAVPGCCRH
jgi:hypothetical protein